MNRLVVAIGSLAFALSTTAVAWSFDATAAPSPIDTDHAVLATIVMSAVTDMKFCALVAEKSQNVEVRSLCRNGSADDERLALEGTQLAARRGATDIALQPLPQTSEMLDSLARYSGREFDRQFLLMKIAYDGRFSQTLRYSIEFTTDVQLKRYENVVVPTVVRQTDGAETILRRLSESLP